MKKMIINLTQHPATEDQIVAGVVEPKLHKSEIKQLLTFDSLPLPEEIKVRMNRLAAIAVIMTGSCRCGYCGAINCEHDLGTEPLCGYKGEPVYVQAMIGGAPFAMTYLEQALRSNKIEPVYAFSKRECVEMVNTDGKVEKKSIFKHAGFVPAIA